MKLKLQRGLTLIELMVGLTIALLVLLIITQIYFGSLSTQKAQDDVTKLNESARFSFDLLSRELRKAGFRNKWQSVSATVKHFCEAEYAILGLNDPTSIDPAQANFTGGTQIDIANNSDVLRVRYYGEDTASTSAVLDCHGAPIAAGTLVTDTLYVAQDPNNANEPTLFCHTTNSPGTPAQPSSLPLVAGVESLQVLYGEDTDEDGVVNRYIPWISAPNANQTNSDNLLSVKISLVTRSPNEVSPTARTRTFNHFWATYPAADNSDNAAIFTSADDRRARQLLSSEIAIRNFRYCDEI
jgi:type IV pilus assembly protein PilW